MDNDSPSSAARGDMNTVNIGDKANVGPIAVGKGITQTIGYTADQVRVLIADIRASYQPKPFDGRSPYVGLASFQEQDADRFFGREKLTQELCARIETARFLVIAGPSGSGKSSLARAGLMHALRRGVLSGGGVLLNAPTVADSENWLYEILAPGRNPLTELARVVSSFAKSLEAGDEIVKRGRADETLLHRWADIALGDQKTRRAILLVDQFEEVFTQVTDEAERAAFLNLVVYAATAESGRVTVVCCTRSDFIGNWAKYPNLNDLLRHGLYQIPPMQPDELVRAIARPAIQVGLPIDETLVKEILDDMRAAPGALPLMQFALQDLFEYAKSKGGVIALTRDDYLARGGLHQALSRHADAAFSKLNAAEQKIARSIFASLVEPGRGNVDTKRTARLQDIVPADTDTAQVKNVITKLADARLVTTDQKDADETVTLAHERLIDAWKWLRDLIDENREAIALQNQISDDAKEWEQHGRDASYLYTGARLATAQEKLVEKKIVLPLLAQTFLNAGQARAETEQQRELARVRAQQEADTRARQEAERRAHSERQAKRWLALLVGVLGVLLLAALWFLGVESLLRRVQARGGIETVFSNSDTVPVPGGTLRLETGSRMEAQLDAFRIEKYEVTNAQYRLCAQDRACSEPSNLFLYAGAAKAKLPVVAITLKQAQDYCHWLGRYVPTELEWEWAAKGAEGWLYPTGNSKPDPRQINVNNFETLTSESTQERRFAVDALLPDKRGTIGMAGNVFEWTTTPWLEGETRRYTTEEWNPETPTSFDKVMARGGGWAGTLDQMYSTSYYPSSPTLPSDFIGFRCAQGAPRRVLKQIP